MLGLSGDDCEDVLGYARLALGLPVRVFAHWCDGLAGVRVIGGNYV